MSALFHPYLCGRIAAEWLIVMFQKVKDLLKRYWGIISYLIFGALTTVVNCIVYLPLYNVVGLSAAVSNAIAWVVSVSFAYLTNKPFVFKSHDWSLKTVLPELMKFVGCRLGSGLTETFIIFFTVDLLYINGNIMKLITSVIVVILNYIASKFLVFRKK